MPSQPRIQVSANSERLTATTQLTDEPLFTSFGTVPYIGICVLVSVILALLVFLPLGYSAGSDRVFGTELAISGVIGDLIYRRLAHRRMTILKVLPWPAMVLWPLLGLALVFGLIVLQPDGSATGKTFRLIPDRDGTAVLQLASQAERHRVCPLPVAQHLVGLVLTAFYHPDRLELAIDFGSFGDSPSALVNCALFVARAQTQFARAHGDEPRLGDLGYQDAIQSGASPELAQKVRDDLNSGSGSAAFTAQVFEEIAQWYPEAVKGNFAPLQQSTPYKQAQSLQTLRDSSPDPAEYDRFLDGYLHLLRAIVPQNIVALESQMTQQ